MPLSYETVVSILHTSGSSEAVHPSADHFPDNEAHQVDTETQCSSETVDEPLSTTDEDISPPEVFSDTTESQTGFEVKVSKTDLSAKTDTAQGLCLVASLRLAAVEQEKEREREMEQKEREEAEKKEKERIEREEMEKKEKERLDLEERDKKEKDRLEREEAKKNEKERLEKEVKTKAKEILEREKEDKNVKEKFERNVAEKKQREQLEWKGESKRMENKQLEMREMLEVQQQMDTIYETDQNDEKKEIEIKRKGKNRNEESLWKRDTPPFFSIAQIDQRETSSQSNKWPSLREAELDDIADDERQQDEECESHPTEQITPNTEASLVSTRPTDSVALSKTLNNKPQNSVSAVKKAPDTACLTSVRKSGSRLEHDAIPAWLREEEEEEVEYEKGQEDLGSIWLAELYMEGEAG